VGSLIPLLILLLTAGVLAIATVFAVGYLRAEARRHKHELAEAERELRMLKDRAEATQADDLSDELRVD
jgi:anti-sigma-K factor RskA